jgi:hypothetical protein
MELSFIEQWPQCLDNLFALIILIEVNLLLSIIFDELLKSQNNLVSAILENNLRAFWLSYGLLDS